MTTAPDAAATSLADTPEYRGLLGWLSSVDHKQIGILYIGSGLLFSLVGLVEGLLMRLQLIKPMATFLSPGACHGLSDPVHHRRPQWRHLRGHSH